MQTRAKSGIFKPKAYLFPTLVVEPNSFTSASQFLEWRQAMSEEFFALQHQGI